MMSFDLKDMYHQAFIHPEHQQHFGLKLNHQFYVFKVLMFGINYAVFSYRSSFKTSEHFFTITWYLSKEYIIYIHDGRVISSSNNLCKSQFDFTLTDYNAKLLKDYCILVLL